jgi:flagellin
MGFSVNTNLDALNTYKNLSGVQNSLSKSLEKLSSGLRINNAGDDAAGLTIATQLGSQVSGLTQAARNAQDGTSVVQTADGALTQAQSLLGRLRDLAVQAANDSNSVSARQAITKEATSITSELTRLGNSVNFNGKKLLDGSANTLHFQVGADGNAASQINVNLTSANLVSVASNLGAAGASFAVASPTTVTGALKFTNGTTDVSVTLGSAGTYKTVQSVADALNNDSNFATGFQASVDGNNNLVVTSATGGTVTGGTAAAAAAAGTGVSTSTAITGGLDFTSASGAQAAITSIDAQLTAVSNVRADIGALENRFASAVSTINTSITNLTAAKSRITDVDMASEMVNYSRANILSQSGTAMLAQANSLPQLALKLLG